MPSITEIPPSLGQSVPADTPHAVSVSLPTWRSNVGYEEGEDWVVSRMSTGYPRFFIQKPIVNFGALLASKHGLNNEHAMLFPSSSPAKRCIAFLHKYGPSTSPQPRLVEFTATSDLPNKTTIQSLQLAAVLYTKPFWPAAKAFWQHTGEGVSSRRAEYFRSLYDEGLLVERRAAEEIEGQRRGPKRYSKRNGSAETNAISTSDTNPADTADRARFLEERFGRNLNTELADKAKLAIRRRISGSLTTNTPSLDAALSHTADSSTPRAAAGLTIDDVFLYPGGMNAIYHTHRALLDASPHRRSQQTICFGFPYIDTLKLLEKFTPAGCLFYGHGTASDLDDLEARLTRGERFLALFCEFPSNPLLRSPDLARIRQLASTYDFAVVVDETLGNFLNVHLLPAVDVLVSSLTKIFSGDSNVMGGSAVLNPHGAHYTALKTTLSASHEDALFAEDALFLERNSRDFAARSRRVNANADAICALLSAHPRIKAVYYPRVNPSRALYDAFRTPKGGYGGLLSATFHCTEDAARFYDALETEKGPSLGTNFTLSSPFVLLAHYGELEWAGQYGAEKDLIRFSVGLEDTEKLVAAFDRALVVLSQGEEGERENGH